MKKALVQRLKDLFRPYEFQELDVYGILEVLGDPTVRKSWLYEVLLEIKRINLDIDNKLNSGNPIDFEYLSARRRGIQFVLDQASSAYRDVSRTKGHNPLPEFDLESVTTLPASK